MVMQFWERKRQSQNIQIKQIYLNLTKIRKVWLNEFRYRVKRLKKYDSSNFNIFFLWGTSWLAWQIQRLDWGYPRLCPHLNHPLRDFSPHQSLKLCDHVGGVHGGDPGGGRGGGGEGGEHLAHVKVDVVAAVAGQECRELLWPLLTVRVKIEHDLLLDLKGVQESAFCLPDQAKDGEGYA